MKTNAALILVLLMVFNNAHLLAQYVAPQQSSSVSGISSGTGSSTDSWASKLRLGGGFSAAFGNPTYIYLAPTLGFQATEKFIPGIGATYIYSNANVQTVNGQVSFSSSIYGGNVFARYIIANNIFAMAQYEYLLTQYKNYDGSISAHSITNPLIGGGLRSPIGPRSSMFLSVLYNLNYENNKQYSPYSSPWVITINFSL